MRPMGSQSSPFPCTPLGLVRLVVLVLGLWLAVAAAYQPLVLRMQFISYLLNADSDR